MPHAYFFLAEHAHPVGPGLASGETLYDTKAIGLFVSRRDAQAAIAQVKDAPGFRDLVDGFSIRRVRVTLAQGAKKQDVCSVSYAYHEYYNAAEGCDVYTTGALYADAADAVRELADMRNEPRLAAHPDGFGIGGYVVGQVMWSEGFTPFEE